MIGWVYGVFRFMADIDSMIGYATTWYGKASRWYFIVCLLIIAPLLLLFIFIMAMIGGFDMSYKAWNQADARYQVPNPEYDPWIQGIIIGLQVSHYTVKSSPHFCRTPGYPIFHPYFTP